ncbi:threonine/serine ThrE exporter family protein [Actinomycetospora atypica]|uniref:Threonine/serine exporter ThrE family protein n=1 Tax=Actinomycetospora atypica TaxID=1290095 RepID=A0ABV9YS09_9PSEU
MSERARGSIRRHVPIPTADEVRRAALDAPTVRDNMLPAMTGPQVADETIVIRVLNLALRVGEVQLATGAGAAVAHDTMLAIAAAYGLPTCDVDIAFSTITMCCHRGVEAGPVTTMRNVRYRTQDYTRLATVDALIKDIVDTDSPIHSTEALRRLSVAVEANHPYPRYVAGVSRSVFASAVSVLIGGGPGVALVSFVLTGVVWSMARWLGRRSVPMFFQQVLAAAVVTTVALGLTFTGVLLDSPAVVVATGIIVLLSGLSLVGLVQDAITGFPLTAAGRAVEVVLGTGGLLVGVVVSIKLAATLGGATALAYALALPGATTPQADALHLVAAAAAGMFFALSAYAPLTSLPVAAAGGAAAWTIYALGINGGLGEVVASAAAATVLGLIAIMIPPRLGLPPLVLVVAGIMPLLPGLMLYTGFAQLAVVGLDGSMQSSGSVTEIQTGTLTSLLAFVVSLALAAGVSFGEQIGWPVARLWRGSPTASMRTRRPRIF